MEVVDWEAKRVVVVRVVDLEAMAETVARREALVASWPA